MKKFLYLALMIPTLALAQDKDLETQSFFKYGVGVFNSAENSSVEVKTLSFGRQQPLGSIFIWQYEGGFWSDARTDVGRSGSGFVNASAGLNVNFGYMYTQSLWGVAYMTSPDSFLGSHEQFNQDFSAGVKDGRGVSIGLNYKHMSSAGIFMPNQGRDFMSVRLGFPL